MKRERIVRAIEKSYRHIGPMFGRAIVRVRVSSPVVAASEVEAFARLPGIKGAYIETDDGNGPVVQFKFKVFSRADGERRAVFLLAWFKSLRCRGARVSLLNAAAKPQCYYRSRRRARRLAR